MQQGFQKPTNISPGHLNAGLRGVQGLTERAPADHETPPATNGAQATDRAAGLQGLSGEFDGATDAEAESGLFGLYDFDYEFFHDSLIWSRRLSRTFRSWAVKLR